MPPPAPAVWKSRMRDFANDCVSSGRDEQADRILEAARILQQGRTLHFACPAATVDRARLDAMLAAGAYESAVLALIGEETAFMLSRGGNGSCLATVVQPDGAEETIAEGATLAMALLAAHISALVEEAEQSEAPEHLLETAAGLHLN